MRKKHASVSEMAREAFARHEITKLRATYAWRCRRPDDSHYHFYVTWAPYMLAVGGDIDELIVRHYSFTDPWDAAAWVNGANFDYFMEKACAEKKYDPDETAQGIIEHAYAEMRAWGQPHELMKAIVEKYGDYHDDPNKAEDRKYACRELLSCAEGGGLEPGTAYCLTDDFEVCVYRYSERNRWPYEGMKLWAKWMWENEPAWHKGVRLWRRVKAFQKRLGDLRRTALWSPIRYAEFSGPYSYGKSSSTAFTYHVFRDRRDGGYFIPIVPLRLFGRSWDWLGFWETSYNSQKDDIVTSPSPWAKPHRFRDIRPGDIAI